MFVAIKSEIPSTGLKVSWLVSGRGLEGGFRDGIFEVGGEICVLWRRRVERMCFLTI